MKNNSGHKPVLLKETIEALHIESQAQYIDATLGSGGHSVEIIKRGGQLFAIEDDKTMLEIARKKLSTACPIPTKSGFYKLIHDNFKNIASIAKKYDIHPMGILFDLGISTIHYSEIKRGFTFGDESQPLDMRLNPDREEVKASDLLNVLRQDQLKDLFLLGMSESEARFLAKRIVKGREIKKFETVKDLLEIIPPRQTSDKIHPATRAFMALRMAVNNELDNLEIALPDAFEILEPGGVLVVITFHSGEEKVVRNVLGKEDQEVRPSPEEIRDNPASRSAKMKIFVKDGSRKQT